MLGKAAAAAAASALAAPVAAIVLVAGAVAPPQQATGIPGGLPATITGRALPGWPVGANGLGPNMDNVRRLVTQRFAIPVEVGHCLARSGHIPGSYHYTGHGCDVTIGAIGRRPTPPERDKGWAIARFLQANAVPLGIDHLIWDGQQWNVGDAQWRPYAHRWGGGVTLGHYDHVHISCKR